MCSLSRETVSISLDKDGIAHKRIQPLGWFELCLHDIYPIFFSVVPSIRPVDRCKMPKRRLGAADDDTCERKKRRAASPSDGDDGGAGQAEAQESGAKSKEPAHEAGASSVSEEANGGGGESPARTPLLRVAVLVPFRDLHAQQQRAEHLRRFVPSMTRFLQRHCARERCVHQ